MAVKRIFRHRLEKARIAGERENFTSVYLNDLLRNIIYVGEDNPLNQNLNLFDGAIWRNTSTNPDVWYILIDGNWVNMVVTHQQHGLMSRDDKVLFDTATHLAEDDSIVIRDGDGGINAIKFNSVSSIRYKENVAPISNATEIISRLEGVTFNWKESGVYDIGLIAEEVEKVLPEIVLKTGGEVQGLAYDHLVAVLIQGFKEQQAELVEIKARLGELENE